MNTAVKIAVIATCFNRRETTLHGLESLLQPTPGIALRLYLTDDGCPQHTGEAVRQRLPDAQILQGDGSLFWNGGMRKAWLAAIDDSGFAPDYILWWNDDLLLLPGALAGMVAFQQAREAQYGPKIITTGKVTDPDTGAVTYGGYIRAPGLSKLRFRRVPDDSRPCVTTNGNLVLIPYRASQEIGLLPAAYSHASGDVHYGLSATRAGYLIFQTPHVVGQTAYNADYAAKTSRLDRTNWRFILTHPKGIPVREWLYFCRTHGGWLWPVNFIGRYLKILRLR